MRSNSRQLVISLLLLSLLIHEAQGIRLLQGNPPDKQHMIQNDEYKPNSERSLNSEKPARKEKNSSSKTDQWQPSEMYPDILDIAGMDYSQARRKPPIHN